MAPEELDEGQRNATYPLGTVLQEVFMEQLLCHAIWTVMLTGGVPALGAGKDQREGIKEIRSVPAQT